MQAGGTTAVREDCHCCACSAKLVERTTKLEIEMAVLEVKDTNQTALLVSIKDSLDALTTDKQRLVGAAGILAVVGASVGGLVLWAANKLLDHVLK